METVFIDGSAGTAGLRIRERLASRRDISLRILPEELRKDPAAREDALRTSDVAFLCLPDAAAREAAAFADGARTIVIDTSTAHRTDPAWEYGFPELAGRRARIAAARRIANPGCHASGFIALVQPLIAAGVLPPSARLCCFSLTGYSGGGKKMIAQYDEALVGSRREEFLGGRQYALGQTHKHLPEMAVVCGLDAPPVFSPVVVPHLCGMETCVQLFKDATSGGLEAIRACYRDLYSGPGGVVRYRSAPPEDGFLSSSSFAGGDGMEVSAWGGEGRIVLVARFDNLGKGACGAAIQNMNIALGREETLGLSVPDAVQ